MRHFLGRVVEVRLEASGQMEACIACPAEAIPVAGQYVQASDPNHSEEVLGTPLYLAEKTRNGFWAASSVPIPWRPGTQLSLTSPLGRGFSLPSNSQRLGLVALGDSTGCLMPFIRQEMSIHRSATLFTDLPLPSLPSSIEAYPIASLKDALDWPDFVVIDLPLQRLAELKSLLGLGEGKKPAFPAQVLITTPMPCAGLAKCGACAVPTQRGWKLACEDGPVFDLNALKW